MLSSNKINEWFDKYQTSKSEEWYGGFNGIISDADLAVNAIEDFKTAVGTIPIVIYGAGMLGANLLNILNRLDVGVVCFIDRDAEVIGELKGYPVYTLEDFLKSNIAINSNYLFIAAGRVNYREITEILDNKSPFSYFDGLAAHIILQSAICSKDLKNGTEKDFIQCHVCSIMSNACRVLRNRFYTLHKINKDGPSTKKNSSMNMLGYVLGQICTLNCKHCCEKTPYFPVSKKTQVSAEEVIKDIHRVVNVCEFLTILEFVGGEPFLHNELYLILKDALNLNNVGFINVFTNGTVKPSDKLCEVLNDQRITVYVSNYSKTLSPEHAEKVNSAEEILKKHNVHYLYGTAKSWQEFLTFDFIDYEKQELQKRFINCFLHSCNRLHRGKLYHCPHHYAGVVLNKIPDDCDNVNIYENNSDLLAEKLDEFIKADCINACKYCSLPFDAPMVTAGIQLDSSNEGNKEYVKY